MPTSIFIISIATISTILKAYATKGQTVNVIKPLLKWQILKYK